jgi:hypothetical protein
VTVWEWSHPEGPRYEWRATLDGGGRGRASGQWDVGVSIRPD